MRFRTSSTEGSLVHHRSLQTAQVSGGIQAGGHIRRPPILLDIERAPLPAFGVAVGKGKDRAA